MSTTKSTKKEDTDVQAEQPAAVTKEPMPPAYEELRDVLSKSMSELEVKIKESDNGSGLESCDMIRLGSKRFLAEANEILRRATEILDSVKGECLVLKENLVKMEAAKDFINKKSDEVNARELAVNNRASKIEAVAEELGHKVGGKL